MRLTTDIERRLQPGDTAYHFDGSACECKLVTVKSSRISESYPENIGLDSHRIVDDHGAETSTMRYYLYCTIENLFSAIDYEICLLSRIKSVIIDEPTTANGQSYQSLPGAAVSVDTHRAAPGGAPNRGE